MTSDLGVDDIVVNFDSPQSISETVISSGQLEESETGAETGAARLTSSLGVELGRLLLAAARDGDCDLVLELMARGAPFTSDWLWTSPLHLAAANAHVDTCAVLLRAGVSRDARTKVDRTPLHFAAYGGHAAVAQLLLQHGAFVDCKDMLLMTPLHWACERGHVQCAAVLLQHGASCSFVSKFLQTPRGIAEARGHEEIVALIDEAVRQREESCEDLKENVTTQSKNDKQNLNESQNNSSAESATAAAALLRQHGITLLPADEGSTVLTALQSGRSVVLSDAGKLMLRESESPPKPITNNTPATTTTAASYNNMLLTATPVRSPPRAGVKIFTVTNKMADKVDLKKVMTTNDMQVKYVAMPGDARSLGTAKPPLRRNTLNVSTVKALQKDGLLKVSGAASNVGAMKILMNKRKLNKLIVDSTTTSTETATTTAISNNKIHKNAEVKEPTVMETESSDTADNIVRVPEEFLRSSSPEYLRAQLLAAHAAIAKLRRELRQARQALADARGQ